MKKVGIVITLSISALCCIVFFFYHSVSLVNPTKRESIADHIISIPKELVLDIPPIKPWCDELVGLKKGFANIEGGKLYYEQEGNGIPLVLISGGPGQPHDGFHPYFSQLNNVARIIYYDQRGTGKSTKDSTGRYYTIQCAVQDLEQLRLALKIDRWAVLGWSYGGLLAQCYALQYPEHCAGLVLVATQSGLFETMAKLNYKEYLIQKPITPEKLTTKPVFNQGIVGNWKHEGYHTQFESLMRDQAIKINLRGMFDNCKIPTLITESKRESLWRDNSNRIKCLRKNHPHAHVEVFKNADHKIFIDEPKKFFALLRDFLEKSNRTQ